MVSAGPQHHVNVWRLLTFGGLGIESDGGSPVPNSRPPRLALLAVVAAAGDRGVSRERLAGLFWPDSDETRARHSLRQSLYALRNDFGRDVVSATVGNLTLDNTALTSDVAEFRSAIAAGQRERAVALARGPFLDGFYLSNASAFERWLEEERARLSAATTQALLSLAVDATQVQDLDAAVDWWRQLNSRDPLNGRFALGYLKALAARGDRVAALAFAREHQAVVRRELMADPDPEVRRLEFELRALTSTPAVEARSAANAQPVTSATLPPTEPLPLLPNAARKSWRIAKTLSVVTVSALLVATALAAGRGWWNRAHAMTPSPIARRMYEEGLRAWHQNDRTAAQRLIRSALIEDSTFAMAAYQEAMFAGISSTNPDSRSLGELRRHALRLAQRAPLRDRLTIMANLLTDDNEPQAIAVAESLAALFPTDPRAWSTLALVRHTTGNWLAAVAAIERAIALDSVAESSDALVCWLCQDFDLLATTYLWADSLLATKRTAARALRARPKWSWALYHNANAAARLRDSSTAYASIRRLVALGGSDRGYMAHLDVALEEYDAAETGVRELLASSASRDWGPGAWLLLISLRSQGRLREALAFHRDGSLPGFPALTATRPGPDHYNEAILTFELGHLTRAVEAFEFLRRAPIVHESNGLRSRERAWRATLKGMALGAVGDTVTLRFLADTVETLGRASLYGRDAKLHLYLRGLISAAAGRHEEAVAAFRGAIHSPTLGFTRVNYELARSLLQLRRPLEAAAVLQPALRGEIDASNLYITRTVLHELLAQAFVAAGQPDSAAKHYRAVTRAWRRADQMFHERRERARAWLQRYENTRRRSS
jgi:DNA-binding SARP family transcriptional activator